MSILYENAAVDNRFNERIALIAEVCRIRLTKSWNVKCAVVRSAARNREESECYYDVHSSSLIWTLSFVTC